MKKYFWNEAQNRPRTLWRLLIHLAIWGRLLALVQIVVLLTQGQAITGEALRQSSVWTRLVTLLIAVYLMARYVDKRRFSDYGLNLKDKEWWYDFIFGVFLGGLLIVGIFLAQYLLGWVEVDKSFVLPSMRELASGTLVALLSLTAVSVYRSLWIWSYTLRNTAEGFLYLNRLNARASVAAALLACIIYFVFIINRALTVNITFVSNLVRASLLLALPFLITRRLGMTIGLALGWNLAQLSIFGYPAAGVAGTGVSFVHLRHYGPAFWTGYPVGLGAGMMAMIALMLAGGIITMWVKWRTGRAIFDGSLSYYTPRAVSSPAVSDNTQKQLDPSAGK